jgi:DnaJ-class molecular chaperone
MLRILFFAVFGVLIYFVFQWLRNASSTDERCGRCDGRGFWYGTRGKEKCYWCKGSGRMPKGMG